MKEIISVHMAKFLSAQGPNINILLYVIILAVNQVNMRLMVDREASALHNVFRLSKRKIKNERSILYLTYFRNNTSFPTSFSKICPVNLTKTIKV